MPVLLFAKEARDPEGIPIASLRFTMTSFPRSIAGGARSAAKLALTLTFAPALFSACASLGPPARTSGPSVSTEGIELAVAAQSCMQSSDTDWPEEDLTETVLEVHVSNGTDSALTVRRDDFRLLTPDGYALRASSWGAVAPLVVVGRETRAFQLRFLARDSSRCRRELRLDPRGGLVVGGRPATVTPVRFVPWHSPNA